MISSDLAGGASSASLLNTSPAIPIVFQEFEIPFTDLLDSARPPLCIPAVSCSLNRVPNLDTCCINSPSGHFLATQFWDTQPAVGANDTWTIHGLWPDYCSGGFDAFCDSDRSLSGSNIKKIIADADANGTHPGLLDYMNQYWLSNNNDPSTLWSHEWNKHGTCISTLEPTCYDRDQEKPNPPELIDSIDVLDYFTHSSLLFNSLPTFQYFADHNIVPSFEKTYSLEQLHDAIRSSPHGVEATIHCRNHNELSEIWYHFNARGSLRNAMDAWWDGNKMWSSWLPTEPDGQVSRCPGEGIRYLPKGDGKDHPPHTTRTATQTVTHTATTIPSGTNAPFRRPFIGKGRLMVKVLPSTHAESGSNPNQPELDTNHGQSTSTSSQIPHPYTGCLIRRGTWYNAHTLSSCAIFTADDDVKLFTNHESNNSNNNNNSHENYHLFTLASRFAPCSFIPSSPSASTSYFGCSLDLQFQTILSNNATIDEQHTDYARRMTVGEEHQGVFFAGGVPRKNGQEVLWTGAGGEGEEKERKVRVEVYWVAVE